jgi:hypothetical protein
MMALDPLHEVAHADSAAQVDQGIGRDLAGP